MPRALGLAVDLAHDDDDDDDEEQHSLIELSSSGEFNPEHSTYSPSSQRRRRSSTTTSPRHLGSASSTSPFCKLIAALFILSIICVYKLGIQEGRNVAYEDNKNGYIEDVESKKSSGNSAYQVLKSKGGGDKKNENEGNNNNPWVLFHDNDNDSKDDGEEVTSEPTKSPTLKPIVADKVVPAETPLPTPSPTKPETPPPVPTYTPTQQEEPSDAEEEEEEEDEDESSNLLYKPPSNPYITKFNTSAFLTFHQNQWNERAQNAIDIKTNYGSYCSNADKFPDDKPMCPPLQVDSTTNKTIYEWEFEILYQGPTIECMDTGTKDIRCGRSDPWLNKTIWPLVRGPFCAVQDKQRNEKFPLPEELKPYYELGYDRVDPTKSTDGKPFNGGTPSPSKNKLFTFGPKIVQDHLLKFEAMLDHYYQGLSNQLLERQISPTPESEYYLPMLQSYANQISRIILRSSTKDVGVDINTSEMNKLVIGVLGDSVTSGTDNCYYDAWPEQLRRQLSPIFASMKINIEIRNAGKNGGWNLSPQMLCAHDMLGVNDDRYIENDGLGLDFLFQCNNFVKATAVDAEHLIRRALLGGGSSRTIISMNLQKDMDGDAFMERYSKYGLSIGNVYQDALPELGLPESGYKYWFPANDRAFWGMQGDGFCHLTTRSGSSSVVNRNWHWGPKTHQTYADAYALLLVRATRMAIDDLVAGRMPPDNPPKPSDVEVLMDAPSEDTPPTYRDLYISDMRSDKADNNNGGISGVRCAVGAANQPNSTLLSHWLRPAEGSPFEEKMKSRNGVSFVPIDHLNSTGFYKVSSPISPPNNAVEVGDWVADPTSFGAEAPRTREQCLHVDGSTLVNMNNKPDISWLVWVSNGVL